MAKNIPVKICGLKDARHISAAVDAGARYLGFNFFKKSPRYIAPDQLAELFSLVPPGVAKVGLTVDASDEELDRITTLLALDMLQLHGSETPKRVAEVRARYGLPVMKAIGVRDEGDLPALLDYSRVADQILVDAKAPKGAELPGGNGLTFDWRLIAGRRWPVPWMLAGGLNAGNVAQAIRLTGARQVDVSSGVETAPGVKDFTLISEFVAAAQSQ